MIIKQTKNLKFSLKEDFFEIKVFKVRFDYFDSVKLSFEIL
jgi:hypothetical protein